MNRIAIVTGILGLMLSTANASTLIVVDQPGCGPAAHFMSEVAATYPAQGIRLRRMSISQATGLSNVAPVRVTPTFILMENGKEVGRMIGYSTKRGFWRGLEKVIVSR